MNTYTAHADTFARDNLPPKELWPDLIYDLPELQYPDHLNAAVELLDKAIEKGWGDRVAIYGADQQLTYRELLEKADQVAHVLTNDLGLDPGNRVLLRGPNHPMLAVCWFGIVKAGMIAVTTMPLLRKKELTEIIDRAKISTALCDRRFDEEMLKTLESSSTLQQVVYYLERSPESLEARMAAQPTQFEAVDTSADDTALIAFTSGTTGNPKATMHFHRDVMAICDTFPRSIVNIQVDDICIGSPPLGFTFGLGGILLFPIRVGGAAVLIEKFTPESFLETIQRFRATISWTAPFFYKKCAELVGSYDIASLRKSVSAGEALPAAIRAQWKAATGIEMIDGIGATEMLHIFISHREADARPGATGKVVPGYQAQVIDDDGQPVPANQVGRLAVKGPTGCRYLADERQRSYVQNGWNVTGDSYLIDNDGYL